MMPLLSGQSSRHSTTSGTRASLTSLSSLSVLGASKEDGEVTFGGIDSSAYKGELTYIPVRRKGHWEVELDVITMDDVRRWLEHPRAVIDTSKATSINVSLSSIVMHFVPGTSLLVLPADIAQRLNLRIAAKKSANG